MHSQTVATLYREDSTMIKSLLLDTHWISPCNKNSTNMNNWYYTNTSIYHELAHSNTKQVMLKVYRLNLTLNTNFHTMQKETNSRGSYWCRFDAIHCLKHAWSSYANSVCEVIAKWQITKDMQARIYQQPSRLLKILYLHLKSWMNKLQPWAWKRLGSPQPINKPRWPSSLSNSKVRSNRRHSDANAKHTCLTI